MWTKSSLLKLLLKTEKTDKIQPLYDLLTIKIYSCSVALESFMGPGPQSKVPSGSIHLIFNSILAALLPERYLDTLSFETSLTSNKKTLLPSQLWTHIFLFNLKPARFLSPAARHKLSLEMMNFFLNAVIHIPTMFNRVNGATASSWSRDYRFDLLLCPELESCSLTNQYDWPEAIAFHWAVWGEQVRSQQPDVQLNLQNSQSWTPAAQFSQRCLAIGPFQRKPTPTPT